MTDTPEHLRADGRALFESVRDEYGIEDAGGLALLTTAAECQDRLRGAQRQVAKDGEFILDRYGQTKAHPAIAVEKDARNGLMAALKQLNLDLEPLADGPGRPPEPRGAKG